MITVYQLNGGNGINFFVSKSEAEKAAAAIPSNWGAAIGNERPYVTPVKLFETMAEWKMYTGFQTR